MSVLSKVPLPQPSFPMYVGMFNTYQQGMMLGIVWGKESWRTLYDALRAECPLVRNGNPIGPGVIAVDYYDTALAFMHSHSLEQCAAVLTVGQGTKLVLDQWMRGDPRAFAGIANFEVNHEPWRFAYAWGPDSLVPVDFAQLFAVATPPEDWDSTMNNRVRPHLQFM